MKVSNSRRVAGSKLAGDNTRVVGSKLLVDNTPAVGSKFVVADNTPAVHSKHEAKNIPVQTYSILAERCKRAVDTQRFHAPEPLTPKTRTPQESNPKQLENFLPG